MNFNCILKEYEKEVEDFFKNKEKKQIKEYSQYFTPEIFVDKMLENLEKKEKKEINILDPACGCGILIIKLISEIYKKSKPDKIMITAFDIDKDAIEKTKKIINKIKIINLKIEIEVINEDFLKTKINNKFDYIISNPPYQKTNIEKITEDLKVYLNGQPNLYHLFIVKSLMLLDKEGVFLILSPKNYLSGKYTEKIRKYILEKFTISRIHTFDERKKIFGDEILQEICILKILNTKKKNVILSYNGHKNFLTNINCITLGESKKIIITPRDKDDLKKIKLFKIFPTNTIGKEIFIKVGKVVQFRVKNREKTLVEEEYSKIKNGIPLIVYRHINTKKFNYRKIYEKSNNRAITIIPMEDQRAIFSKNTNYVFIKKSVEKSSEKLLFPVQYLKELNGDTIAIDNGLSYITNGDDSLKKIEVKGIYCVLNSMQFDDYYRMLNSSHTINGYELEAMHFPSLKQINEIGKMCSRSQLTIEKCTEIMKKYFEMNCIITKE